MTLLKDKLFVVYATLLGVTAISWFMSYAALLDGAILAGALLGLAFIKVRLIVIHYMEAKHARLGIRLAFEGWIVLAAATTIALALR